MSDQSFLFERQSLWLWTCLVTLLIFGLVYIFHDPIGPANGGTGYGMVTGTVATVAMVFLMLYAKRKRAYLSTLSTLKMWLSAHVWVGFILILLVPLHSGFQFGYNIHSLSYLFIIITILTGIWGTFLCITLPPTLKARREGLSVKSLLIEIQDLSGQVSASLQNKSAQFIQLANEIDFVPEKSIWKIVFNRKFFQAELNQTQVGSQINRLSEGEQSDALRLIGIVERKILLANKLYRELKMLSLLKIWLYVHLPFAVGAFTLVVIHIFSIFYLR